MFCFYYIINVHLLLETFPPSFCCCFPHEEEELTFLQDGGGSLRAPDALWDPEEGEAPAPETAGGGEPENAQAAAGLQ